MPQYFDLELQMGIYAAMLGIFGLGAWFVWRREEESRFFQLWFEIFSKWLGASTLFGLLAFSLVEYPIIPGVIFWGMVIFVLWAKPWKD